MVTWTEYQALTLLIFIFNPHRRHAIKCHTHVQGGIIIKRRHELSKHWFSGIVVITYYDKKDDGTEGEEEEVRERDTMKLLLLLLCTHFYHRRHGC